MPDAVLLGAMAIGVALILGIVVRSQRRAPVSQTTAPGSVTGNRSVSLIACLIALIAGGSILYWQYQFGFPDVFSTAIGGLVVLAALIGLLGPRR